MTESSFVMYACISAYRMRITDFDLIEDHVRSAVHADPKLRSRTGTCQTGGVGSSHACGFCPLAQCRNISCIQSRSTIYTAISIDNKGGCYENPCQNDVICKKARRVKHSDDPLEGQRQNQGRPVTSRRTIAEWSASEPKASVHWPLKDLTDFLLLSRHQCLQVLRTVQARSFMHNWENVSASELPWRWEINMSVRRSWIGLFGCLAICLFGISPVMAADDEEHTKVISEYLVHIHAAEQFRLGLQQSATGVSEAHMDPLYRRLIGMSDAELVSIMVPAYKRLWPLQDAKNILVFFKSEAGEEFARYSAARATGKSVVLSKACENGLRDFLKTESGQRYLQSNRLVGQELNKEFEKLMKRPQ